MKRTKKWMLMRSNEYEDITILFFDSLRECVDFMSVQFKTHGITYRMFETKEYKIRK